MNENLDQILFEELLKAYAKKGINVQAILDNSLFQQLPLQTKISLLKSNIDKLVVKPTMGGSINYSSLVKGGLGGALASIATVAAAGAKTKGVLPFAGMAGGLLGTLTPLLNAKDRYNKDISTYNNLKDNKFINSLINRSVLRAKDTDNKYIDKITDLTNKGIIKIDSLPV